MSDRGFAADAARVVAETRHIVAMNPNTYKWAKDEPSVRFMASGDVLHLRSWIPEGQIGRITEEEWQVLLDKYEPPESQP